MPCTPCTPGPPSPPRCWPTPPHCESRLLGSRNNQPPLKVNAKYPVLAWTLGRKWGTKKDLRRVVRLWPSTHGPSRDLGWGHRLTASCDLTAKGYLPGRSLTMEAKMGRNRVVVATLLVHSVNAAMSRDRIRVMAAGGTECKGSICFPIHSDSPEAWEAQEGSHQGWQACISRAGDGPGPSPGSSAPPVPMTLSLPHPRHKLHPYPAVSLICFQPG